MTKRRKTYEKGKLEAAIQALDNMAKKAADSDVVKTKQAVTMMKKSIRAARRNGATWQEVMEALRASGVEISMRTIMDMTNGSRKKEAKQQKKAPAPVPAPAKTAPPVVPPGQFVIKPDRGADL